MKNQPAGVGGSMKASHETGSTTNSGNTKSESSESSESMVFEATGGNTILAAESVISASYSWRLANDEP